jgi:hypothetical protein
MFFPRETVRIGDCLAIICTAIGTHKHVKLGEPIKHLRPSVRFEDETWRAPRLAYHLNVARILRCPRRRASGLILHTCDHEWCVEPSHLYKGTQKQNMMDVSRRHPTIRATRSNNMKKRMAARCAS